ncbi:MAG: ATP-binding protein [Thiolinea sp.]
MKLGIAQKLFLAFLSLTLLVLVATLSLARWSFERGFFEYVNAREQNRLQNIATRLEDTYLAAGSDWSKIPTEQLQRSLYTFPDSRLARHRKHKPHHRAKKGAFEKRKRPPPLHLPPTMLLDQNKQVLAGHLPEHAREHLTKLPVIIEGETVAYLLSQRRRSFESPQETSFARQQLLTSLLIGAASLLLAAIVSWWLARLLVAPVRRMISGVKQLSDGDYSTRVEQENHDELGQLSTDINHLATTLEENQNSRRRWLADISHELRTPVTILTGEISALQEGIRPFNQQQLQSLDHETERLRHLIDDLYQLSLSDMGGLRYNFSPCDLGEKVQQVVNSLSNSAIEQGISIHTNIDSGVMINGDHNRISQLLTNIIQNSLAYTDAPGTLDILLQHQSQANKEKQVILEFNDTPPGVTTEECQQLFEPLYRRDESRNRRTAGAGLGLAICRNIAKAHRADITATPSASGGLCIHISFPALTPEHAG